MHLKYKFETMDMNDIICAVPVGKESDDFHGVLQFNKSGAEIFDIISKSSSKKEALEKLVCAYPNENSNIIEDSFSKFLDKLVAENLLELDD